MALTGFYPTPIQNLMEDAQADADDPAHPWVQTTSNGPNEKKRKSSVLSSPNQAKVLPKPMIIQIQPRPSQIMLARKIKETFPFAFVAHSRELRSPDEIFVQPGDENTRKLLFNVINLNSMFPNSTIAVRNPLQRQNVQPSYVITNVSHDFTLEDIKQELAKTNSMPAKEISRIVSRATNQPTKLIRVFTTNPEHALSAVKHGVYLGFQRHRCEESNKKPNVQQCFKCQGFGHMAKNCEQNVKCLRCSGNHTLKECTTPKDNPICANCGEQHASVYKGCKTYQIEVNKVIVKQQHSKTYASAVSQPITNSFQVESVVVFIADLFVKLRSTLNTMSSSDVIAAVSQSASMHFQVPISGPELYNQIHQVNKKPMQAVSTTTQDV